MIIDKDYMEMRFKGSAFEVGQKLGHVARQSKDFREFILQKPETIPPSVVKKIQNLFEKHCPNVNREIEGMAAVLDVNPEDICYYLYSHKFRGACAHFALTSEVTENGHTLIGRNYEYSPDMTDCLFMDIDEEGCARSLGFTSIIFGKIDGMNEHGLAMTMTGGIPPVEDFYTDGFLFWVVIRKVLDTCKDVYEALEVIRSMEAGYSPTYLVADRTGSVMLVEQTPERLQYKIIHQDSDEHLLAATNHFNLKQMIPLRKHFFKQSKHRYDNILETFGNSDRKYTVEDIKTILTDEYPKGLNGPYYTEYFGTLWSSIFDSQAGEISVRMGNTETEWRNYSFKQPLTEGVKAHHIKLNDQKSPADFWDEF
ncbi:MAG TPA: C45 family autoproteolytic acyltransferase/hydrolase [Thermotogota bacterium]|nr:C45 family autoproteolytic acyltransferase/hydrolase [Thermotogota bacterium]HPJ89366.1 C45 family autoproteolytic acyltransferase/hydrolase [Thermotogota bacterium]HPR97104.1 C45 family autoproteolytic acyltransferase/hydrolase [Thermotogota bacterium]